jgi:HAE1 family hydrophobic/amphiphilic exporter-1
MDLQVSDPTNPMAKGKLVRLSDVADVQDSVVERRSYSRLNGSDSVLLVLQKAREGNAVEISKTAHNVVMQIEQDYKGQKIQFVTTDDSATRIEESLSDLYMALFLGITLVAVIVYVFLHNFRGTLIVAAAIPTSIFATFIGMKLMGFTINTMTMLAMSLAVGVLVDDAIVVIENIYRHLRMGEEPRHAALHGRAEIGLAAMAITLADVVVFLPIGFMGGIVGQFFRPLGLSYAVAVIVSLFVSFTLTPMLASRWYRAGEDLEHPTGRFAVAFERGFGAFSNFYRRALEWSLRHRWFVFTLGNLSLVAVIVMIVGSFFVEPEKALNAGLYPMAFTVIIGAVVVLVQFIGRLFGSSIKVKPQIIVYAALFGLIFPAAAMFGHMSAIKWKKADLFTFQFFPNSDTGAVEIKIQLPPGSSLAETGKVVEKIEKIVSTHEDMKYVLSSVGTQSAGVFSAGNQGSNYGSVLVSLNDKAAMADDLAFWKKSEKKLRHKSDTKVAAEMLQRIGRMPEAEVFVSTRSSMGFGAAIQVSLSSDNRAAMLEEASKLKRRLKAGEIPGLINPEISSKPGKPELRAIPDRTKLADAGVSTAQVANTLRILYEGNNDTKFRVSGKEYDIRVMMDRRDRDNPTTLGVVPITFQQGSPIFLNQVATLSPGLGIDKINRRNRGEEVVLSADLLPGYAAGNIQNDLNRLLDKEKSRFAALGITYKPLGQADFQARESGFLFGALFLGLILVYMLLASLYDNILYPLIIQMAQPQAMVGALLALMITDKPLNIVGFIGMITLVGLVGKNAILLVDYTNTLRSRGKSRHDALVESGPTRLRPILMTTFALILSMLPIALAIGRGSEFRSTIGITILGGITLSTFLTLLVIPCSYTIFDDISLAFARVRHKEPGTESDLSDEVPPEKPSDEDLG